MKIISLRAWKVCFFLFAMVLASCSQPQGKTAQNNKKAAPAPETPQPAPQAAAPDAIKIVVSTPPQKYLVKRLTGDRAYVVSLLNENDNIMAVEHLNDTQSAELADAKIFFKIGAPFEKDLKIPPTCRVYDMLNGQKLRPFSSHTQYLNDGKSFVNDPYVWMSPVRAVKMLPEVYQALRTVGQEKDYPLYSQNFTRFTRELNSLEGDIQRILLNSLSRDILVAAPVLGYFCDDFGLKQFTYDFSAAGAGEEFIRAAIERKIRVVLFSPAAPGNVDGRTANLLGGAVETVNPMAEDYPTNLLRIASAIAGRRYEAQ